jgi:16S rRNA (cytosine967-C5)-methyltransferase
MPQSEIRNPHSEMKLHFSLMQAVADTLIEIFQNGKYADKVIEKVLRADRNRGAKDRAFIAENTYECVRYWRRLWFLKTGETTIPENFSATDMIQLIGIQLILKGIDLPIWDEFRHLEKIQLLSYFEKLNIRKIYASIPDWLDEKGVTELGAVQWGVELNALNQPSKVALRVNFLKTDLKKLQLNLSAEGFDTDIVGTESLVLKKRGNIFQSTLFQAGQFEIQDIGSQAITRFLEVEPGMRVIDACAGAGGKTMHLATIMENKGKIIALDTEQWKLDELKKRAKRNGAHIIEVRALDSTKVIKRLHESADRVLLDVPCSGLGVLRRNPDAKWKLSPEFIAKIMGTQQQILQDYSKMTKIGGKLVYATCSIFPSENEKQVELFLKQNPNFKFLKEQKISPARDGFDGFYMALLERV